MPHKPRSNQTLGTWHALLVETYMDAWPWDAGKGWNRLPPCLCAPVVHHSPRQAPHNVDTTKVAHASTTFGYVARVSGVRQLETPRGLPYSETGRQQTLLQPL